jgi:large subunit ribosomal protein L9e
MRLVYAHFPINANAESDGKALSIRNFLGEKIVRTIPMCEGVKVVKDVDTKDQLLFEGNNIEAVSRCARSAAADGVHAAAVAPQRH